MITCRDVPDIASDYISREGALSTRLLVKFHLAQCVNCRTYVRGLKIARQITADSHRGHLPPGLLAALGLNDPSGDPSSKEPGP